MLPRFILPPKVEQDGAIPLLIDCPRAPDIANALLLHWNGRPAIIDCSYVIDEYGREQLVSWLPNVFARARKAAQVVIPAALLNDLGFAEAVAFRSAIGGDQTLKFALCVQADEMVDATFGASIGAALSRLGLSVSDCAVIVDFGRSEFSQYELVADILRGALESLQDLGQWQHIIFQGTHYPEANPAKDGETQFCDRNEWRAWKRAVRFDPSTAEQMIFGDYAADCAKMEFTKGSGAPAIRHIRYTTGDRWRVERAVKTGTDAARMKAVYKAIAKSADFLGRGFSSADAFIALAASDSRVAPGNAKTWRQLNTTHHITHVVSDIAKVRDRPIQRIPAEEPAEQFVLLS